MLGTVEGVWEEGKAYEACASGGGGREACSDGKCGNAFPVNAGGCCVGGAAADFALLSGGMSPEAAAAGAAEESPFAVDADDDVCAADVPSAAAGDIACESADDGVAA